MGLVGAGALTLALLNSTSNSNGSGSGDGSSTILTSLQTIFSPFLKPSASNSSTTTTGSGNNSGTNNSNSKKSGGNSGNNGNKSDNKSGSGGKREVDASSGREIWMPDEIDTPVEMDEEEISRREGVERALREFDDLMRKRNQQQ